MKSKQKRESGNFERVWFPFLQFQFQPGIHLENCSLVLTAFLSATIATSVEQMEVIKKKSLVGNFRTVSGRAIEGALALHILVP